jgi:hypothetical protein
MNTIEQGETMNTPADTIPGWGADARLENRPGVPHETDPPMPIGNMSLIAPVQQVNARPTAKSAQKPLTPVYGTSIPLHGLSGVVRRIAYRIPDYKMRHWGLLLLADRIDLWEHRLVPTAAVLAVVGLGFAGLRVLRRAR